MKLKKFLCVLYQGSPTRREIMSTSLGHTQPRSTEPCSRRGGEVRQEGQVGLVPRLLLDEPGRGAALVELPIPCL